MQSNILESLKVKNKILKLSMKALIGALTIYAGASLYSANAMIKTAPDVQVTEETREETDTEDSFGENDQNVVEIKAPEEFSEFSMEEVGTYPKVYSTSTELKIPEVHIDFDSYRHDEIAEPITYTTNFVYDGHDENTIGTSDIIEENQVMGTGPITYTARNINHDFNCTHCVVLELPQDTHSRQYFYEVGVERRYGFVSRSEQVSEEPLPDLDIELEEKPIIEDEIPDVSPDKKITKEQKLYVLKALNVQDVRALLRTRVIEMLRFSGGISSIMINEHGARKYTADKGDSFAQLLFMLYPSDDGTLKANTRYQGRDSFAKYGGITPGFMAKVCAVLNDYRNNQVSIPQIFDSVFLTDDTTKFKLINPDFISAVKWMGKMNILDDCENLVIDLEKAQHEGKTIVQSKKTIEKIESLKKLIQRGKQSKKPLSLEEQEKLQNLINDFPKMFPDKACEYERLMSDKLKLKYLQRYFQDLADKLNLYNQEINRINRDYARVGFIFSFINALKGAIDLEMTEDFPYPKYLTEKILMSYMVHTKADIEKFYSELKNQLMLNESNKLHPEEDSEERINAEIKRLLRLKDMLLYADENQELSPYKSATISSVSAYTLDLMPAGLEVKFYDDTFADCADITARHMINLLVYSNADPSQSEETKWNFILKDADIEDLNEKLEKVKQAITDKSTVEFYDFETRLKIFFLHQMKNGVDDCTILTRTLWEYAICNMDTNEHLNKSDRNKNFYDIVYKRTNIELYTGYVNMIKLMWNIACALNFGNEKIDDDKTKLELVRSNINVLSDKSEYDFTLFENTLKMIFSLFHPNEDLTFTSDCRCEMLDDRTEIVGKVDIKVEKLSKTLNFQVSQSGIHAYVTHDPVGFIWKDRFSHSEYIKDDFNRFVLKRLSKGTPDFYKITITNGFYWDFSKSVEEIVDSNDVLLMEQQEDEIAFRNTNLYKQYKVLNVFKALQDENDNAYRIKLLLSDDIIETSELIEVKDSKDKKKMFDIFYERYLKPNDYAFCLSRLINKYEVSRTGKKVYNENAEELTYFKYIQADIKGDVHLIIDEFSESDLTIPSVVFDEVGNKLNVVGVGESNLLENLETINFVGNFDVLKILSGSFLKCANLRNIHFKGKVNILIIEKGAFSDCVGLTSFKYPDGMIRLLIEDGAFLGCFSLKNVKLLESEIGLKILNYTSIDDFQIADSVTRLAIFGCNGDEKIQLPADVTNFIFLGYTGNHDFQIPDGVINLTVESERLNYFMSKRINIPDSVKTLKLNNNLCFSRSFDTSNVKEIKILYYRVNDGCLDLNSSMDFDFTFEDLEDIVLAVGYSDVSNIHEIHYNSNYIYLDLGDRFKGHCVEEKSLFYFATGFSCLNEINDPFTGAINNTIWVNRSYNYVPLTVTIGEFSINTPCVYIGDQVAETTTINVNDSEPSYFYLEGQ